MNTPDLMGFAAALSAAASTGLLGRLIEGPARSAEEHARTLTLDPRATGLVIDVLVAFGLVARTSAGVVATDALGELARSPGGTQRTIAMWSHVPEFLRTGRPFMMMDGAREQAYAGVVSGLGQMFHEVSRVLAAELALPSKNILDVGCGSGVWGLALAERAPGARVTGLDLPAVLEAFRARAAELGLADRIDTLPGDVHAMTIPRAYDLVIIANVLRIEAPDRARAIVQRAAGAIAPGGKLLVIDALAGGTPSREQARAVYGLHLGMRTAHGRVYSRAEIGAWIAEAGLREERALDLDMKPGALGVIVAA